MTFFCHFLSVFFHENCSFSPNLKVSNVVLKFFLQKRLHKKSQGLIRKKWPQQKRTRKNAEDLNAYTLAGHLYFIYKLKNRMILINK